ncbi:hypothetical protein AVEN_176433-1 [Araneus ventricosus]|uniref:Mutator-like transposase domain-containing protein n=1 Tax=Araneus ventricosus TaxID=182803 RepID=A0A4Y2PJX1_ARAVE|nr:hypothetical protein AVEN_176433-1 [Araneus ventricosus]
MEVEGMKKFFLRSVSERGVRYLSYLGDGDASTFKDVCEDKPYGINTTIEKVEYVGHVQKLMGTHLRRLKKDMKRKKLADGKTIGGRGRLKDELIKKLTTYYGYAIKKNKINLFSMRKDIWAIWMHFLSTDADPQHHFCPTGEKFKHKSSVPKAVMDTIKPIFKDLSNSALLKRCLGGKTQNTNKSLNSLVWNFCSKNTNSSKKIAQIASNLACISYNRGEKGILNVLKELELDTGEQLVKDSLLRDKERIKLSERCCQKTTLEARKAKNRPKTAEKKTVLKSEGKIYSSAAF